MRGTSYPLPRHLIMSMNSCLLFSKQLKGWIWMTDFSPGRFIGGANMVNTSRWVAKKHFQDICRNYSRWAWGEIQDICLNIWHCIVCWGPQSVIWRFVRTDRGGFHSAAGQQRLNSWTCNFVEVPGHNLESFPDLRFPYTVLTLQNSFKPLLFGGGGG